MFFILCCDFYYSCISVVHSESPCLRLVLKLQPSTVTTLSAGPSNRCRRRITSLSWCKKKCPFGSCSIIKEDGLGRAGVKVWVNDWESLRSALEEKRSPNCLAAVRRWNRNNTRVERVLITRKEKTIRTELLSALCLHANTQTNQAVRSGRLFWSKVAWKLASWVCVFWMSPCASKNDNRKRLNS